MLVYKPIAGEQIDDVLKKVVRLTWSAEKSHRVNFNGITIEVDVFDTYSTAKEKWVLAQVASPVECKESKNGSLGLPVGGRVMSSSGIKLQLGTAQKLMEIVPFDSEGLWTSDCELWLTKQLNVIWESLVEARITNKSSVRYEMQYKVDGVSITELGVDFGTLVFSIVDKLETAGYVVKYERDYINVPTVPTSGYYGSLNCVPAVYTTQRVATCTMTISW